MIKDRLLKIKLIEYFIKCFWYPQMEVNVLSKQRVSSIPKIITDIDVIGVVPDAMGHLKIILGDCKTLKNQSPISRSLWMKGLMDYMESDKGVIILSKEIEKEHQLTSSELNIQLLSEKDFDIYSKATADYSSTGESALANIDNWDLFFEIDKIFPRLKDILDFSRTKFWNESSSNHQLRAGLSILKIHKGELNPDNKLHLSVVLNHFSLMALSLNQIIITLFNRYLNTKSKEELNNDLKVIIYGGIENYDFLNGLRKRFVGADIAEKDLTLPEWDTFIEFIRLTFVNPRGFINVPLLFKEIAFNFLDVDPIRNNYSSRIIRKDNHTTNFAIRLSEYFSKACNLPPEFHDNFTKAIVFLK